MKKIISLVAVLTTITALASLPLAAGERRGATVEVTMADGSQVRGELLAVKSDALLVYDNNARQGRSLDLGAVIHVKLFKKGKFLKGLGIGLEVGLGLSLYLFIRSDQHENSGLVFCTLLPITGLFGGLLGALSGTAEEFVAAGEYPQFEPSELERLKRFAREQDPISRGSRTPMSAHEKKI